jgi:hypothetical protein
VKDLVVLAADQSIEAALRGLLSRPNAIGMRPVDFDTLTHPRRDPGCRLQAHELLSPFCGLYRHALVVFDREGSGGTEPALAMEDALRQLLHGRGWKSRAEVVVIDPELDVWVWSDSPRVSEALQWTGRKPPLREWLRFRGLWPAGQPKPTNPKAAVLMALRDVGIPPSSSIYLRLATSVSVVRCVDPAFDRLRAHLRTWFPPS